jgi:glycine/D-amino acid oxidase-like deaminating enzyme
MTEGRPSRSPWIDQLRTDLEPRPLDSDITTDVAVVGAGIAGLATAFFLLRETDERVLLIERDSRTRRRPQRWTTDQPQSAPVCRLVQDVRIRQGDASAH